MSIDNEIARRNYALTAQTFDCEHLLQISCGDEILVTVNRPVETNMFAVFNGNGLDEEENDLPIDNAVKLIAFTSADENDAWRQIARFGYLHALGKMMTADQREERETYGLVA
jgi:hypothetical protein